MNGEHLSSAYTFAEPTELGERTSTLRIEPPVDPVEESCPQTKTSTLLVGFDWGTKNSCVRASFAGSTDLIVDETIPTVVGYANEGIIEDLLPDNAKVLFGQEAIKNRLHVRLVAPMNDGVLKDLDAAKDFAGHIREIIKASATTELRAVIGVPANAEGSARENLRKAVRGLFKHVILIPEPFLAALGYREESRLGEADYRDPITNSLFIDIGGGTTDLCLVQGYFPSAQDQISIPFAGDEIDELLSEALGRAYPNSGVSMMTIREIKEQNSFVGSLQAPVIVNVLMGGKMRQLDLTEQIRCACEELLKRTLEAAKVLVARAPSDSVSELLQNIILTGGGSGIRGFDTELQRLLAEEGYENPRVHLANENYKTFVAQGALKAARQTKENQWQKCMS